MRSIRIGSGAGYAGDRIEPAVEIMEKGNVDYIIFECLAERTIAIGQKAKLADPNKGYNGLLESRMEKILPLAKKNNIKVITNMGSANPEKAAEITAEIAKDLSLSGLKIAAVLGDNISDNIDQYYDKDVLEFDKKLGEIKEDIISANAYIGCEGIVEALENGADIIITGRVADPALTIGPLVHEFGWTLEDADKMGQATLAGHLLECAGQVTGGYFADPGYKDVPNLDRLGFPIAQIREDGDLIISKVEESGGVISPDTCKEQMIYEIHDPSKYLTPDVSADFSKVEFEQIAKDQVKASCATSHQRPETLKVSIGYKDCFIGEGEISYGGSNAFERAKLAEDIVKKRLEIIGCEYEEIRVDYIGMNSLYSDFISQHISGQIPGEVRLRMAIRTKDKANATLLGNELETLYTNGPAGGGGATKSVNEVISICSIFIPRKDIELNVKYLEV